MRPISFRLGDRDRALLGHLADQLGVSRGAVVRLALRSLDERLRARADGGLEGVLDDSARSLERKAAA